MKEIIFSGVQPSGKLTIGNYLGSIKNWVPLQDEYDCFFCIVDEHAITVRQKPADLRQRTLEVFATYLACGIDQDKSSVFIQSHVPEHVQLSWVLSSICYTGELGRMIQYKEKIRKNEENANAALYTYPVLMAADILLYNADLVPVGIDQKQHLEITKTIAKRFNNLYSDTFKIPEIYYDKATAKIMSLQDYTIKMSKSDDNKNAFISIMEDEDSTASKIKKAVTDSVGVINYTDSQPALKNLINIYSAFSHETPEEIVDRFSGKGYGDFKNSLAEVVNESLRPVREKYNKLMDDKAYLQEECKKGAEKARRAAYKMLKKVYRKIGFVSYD